MKSIGGYFELELNCNNSEYHSDAIRLNTGRNAFEYILRAREYNKVFLPFFTCEVMLEPLEKLNIEYEFYHIGVNFEPVFDFNKLSDKAAFVYTNYFGINDEVVKKLSGTCKNLIIDNAQAFYSSPEKGVDTFYSPRKFFGVPDGAYLYTEKRLDQDFAQDFSYDRMKHLLGRIDSNPEEFYGEFKKNSDSLKYQDILKMSNLTKRLLQSVDYEYARKRRRENFLYLHSALKETNLLNLNLAEESVPMVYPYLTESGVTIKEKLIMQKIYVATYWPNVLSWTQKTDHEYFLAQNLVNLPIDQRYEFKEMDLQIGGINEKS